MTTKLETMTAAATGEGCLGKSADDEPVFVLCARDPLASMTVRTWATGAIAAKLHIPKITSALEIANEMDAWRAARDKKAAAK